MTFHRKLRLAITGSTGMIGSAIVRYFENQGHVVYRILRPESPFQARDEDQIHWDIISKQMDLDRLENMDVVIHLTGANLAQKRWTKNFKQEILSSRRDSTTFLCEALYKLKNPPQILFSASAIGFYGCHHGLESLDENAIQGGDFLAQVCGEWEQATRGAELAGIRVIHMRMGAVISEKGGALAKMLPIFKLGLGGPIGSGRQIFSWIALDEIPLAIMHLITKASHIKGAVNFVSPDSVSNAEFSKMLGQVLNRPAFLSAPGFAMKMVFGEMADALLLSSSNVISKNLKNSGYQFQYPSLKETLIHYLKHKKH